MLKNIESIAQTVEQPRLLLVKCSPNYSKASAAWHIAQRLVKKRVVGILCYEMSNTAFLSLNFESHFPTLEETESLDRMYLNDQLPSSSSDVLQHVRNLVQEHHVSTCIINHMQSLPTNEPLENQLTALHDLSIELGVSVILITDASKTPEQLLSMYQTIEVI